MADDTKENNAEKKLSAPDKTNNGDVNVNAVPTSQESTSDEQTQNITSNNDLLSDDKEFFEALEASVNKVEGKGRHTHLNDEKISNKRLLRIEITLLIGSALAAASLIYSFYRSKSIAQNFQKQEDCFYPRQ